jgi:hypothetical protein
MVLEAKTRYPELDTVTLADRETCTYPTNTISSLNGSINTILLLEKDIMNDSKTCSFNEVIFGPTLGTMRFNHNCQMLRSALSDQANNEFHKNVKVGHGVVISVAQSSVNIGYSRFTQLEMNAKENVMLPSKLPYYLRFNKNKF